MDVTMNASNIFHGIVYLMWLHWIYCVLLWKDTFPGKKYLGLIHAHSSEPCFISARHYTRDLSCGSHPWLHTLKYPKNGEWFAAVLGSLVEIYDGQTLCLALWTSRFCGVWHVLLHLYLLTSGMGPLGAAPMKFAGLEMTFTQWEVLSPFTPFSRFWILPYGKLMRVPGYMFPVSGMSSADNNLII